MITLQTDAALAYDAAIRARRSKKYYTKINFATEKSYSKAREKELKARDINIDLREILVYMTDRTSIVEEEASEEMEVEEVEEDGVTSLLSELFRGNGDVSRKKTSKKKKIVTPSTTSQYHGVYMKRFKHEDDVFVSQFCDYRLGSYYLETDAALVYDSAIRARGLEEHYNKINFDTKEEYLQARKKEMKVQSLEVDLEEALVFMKDMIAKVFKA